MSKPSFATTINSIGHDDPNGETIVARESVAELETLAISVVAAAIVLSENGALGDREGQQQVSNLLALAKSAAENAIYFSEIVNRRDGNSIASKFIESLRDGADPSETT